MTDTHHEMHRIMLGLAEMARGIRLLSQGMDSGLFSFEDSKDTLREMSRILDEGVAAISA
jgi:hypothetical protein